MSNGQNTGRRYIPKFFTYDGSTEWRPNVAYTAKTIVTRNFKVYTSIVNVPSNVGAPEDNPKYWQAAVITDEVMQTIIDELGKLDGDVSEFEHRVEVVENEVGEVEDEVEGLKNNLEATQVVDSASGAIASFPDGGDGFRVRDLKVRVEPIQAGSGDPSPDNVRPISGRPVVTVTRTGFNVWDEEWEQGDISWTGQNGDSDSTRIRSKNYIPVIPNTTYYAKTPTTNGNLQLFYYNASKQFISYGNSSVGNATFQTPNNACFMRFYTYSREYGATYNHDISINYPSTDHDYHAYQGQSIEIQLGQTVYGGTLDVTNGVLTVDRALVDLGTLDWTYQIWGSSNTFYATLSNVKIYQSSDKANWVCSEYGTVSANTVYLGADKKICNNGDFVRVSDTAYPDATTFKSAMDGVQLVYELATPITVQLTAQQLTTLLGQNNVWSDADSVSVDYVADTKLYITKVIADALS